jgi:hypothetical protein
MIKFHLVVSAVSFLSARAQAVSRRMSMVVMIVVIVMIVMVV